MQQRRPILIQCPHLQRLVPGTYETGPNGDYLLAQDGSFLLARARCGHSGGHCTETLCALHRYNRRGPRTWFPERILSVGTPSRRKGKNPAQCIAPPSSGNTGCGLDLLC
jgi:hypothetical protein